jgi:hypothetical protein
VSKSLRFLNDLYNNFAGYFYLCQVLVNLRYITGATNALRIRELSETLMKGYLSREY